MVDEAKSSIDANGAPGRATLAGTKTGARVRVVAVRLDADVADWLAAVGLHEQEELVVLRRAVLGGPLHVRTSSGGEFAVARELAEKLDVVAAPEGRS